MKTLAISALLALSTVFGAQQAVAGVIHSETAGNWELMAWDGNNQFCALKTYFGDSSTVSIRMSANRRVELVVYDPNLRFRRGASDVQIAFDGDSYGYYTGETRPGSPNQIFINVGNVDYFLDRVKYAREMTIGSDDLHYDMNLVGTVTVGDRLEHCVSAFFS